MANKAATASIIAAVGVVAVIGAIAAVTTAKKAHEEGPVSANIKLSTLCSSTLYPNKCESSLTPVVNETSNPEDVLRAALQVALDEVHAALARSGDVGKGASDSITKSAVAECKKLLDDAILDLKDMAGLDPVKAVSHVSDLRTWLSGVMTYIYTCADGFEKPELKESMDKVLRNSTELSSNALAIITLIGDFMKGEQAKANKAPPPAGSRRLLGWQIGQPAGAENRRRLLAINGKLDEISEVKDASRRLLFQTLNEITEMSNHAKRRLLGDEPIDAASNVTDNFDLVSRRRLMSMSFNDASNVHAGEEDSQRRQLSMMFNSISNMSKKADLVRRRLLSLCSNDGCHAPNGTFEDNIGRRRLMSMSFNGASKAKEDDAARGRRRLLSLCSNDECHAPNGTFEDNIGRRRLMSMSFNGASKAKEDDATRGRRKLLSIQIEGIASMSSQLNRQLLATVLPDDLAGKRQLLSASLTTVNDVATGAKGQLDAIGNGAALPEESHRVLTTDVVGTIDDLDNKGHPVPSSAFPAWVPRRDRRLLQLGAQAPNTVVAADGSGNFKTITEALNGAPKKSEARYVIYVKAGEYKEYVTITKDMPNIFMYGDGPTKTRVVGDKSNKGGFATIATRTFSAEGNGFICKSMGFVNAAGPDGHQAVALHVQGDMSVFFNCRFEGYQDTLYVHANRQFFRNCEVLGTIDFVFGNSAALLQNCLMTVRKPMESQANMVTAQGRTDPNMPTGIVLQGCRIVPEQDLFPVRLQIASYLGRPWKEYAKTVVMESTIGDLIKPEGWSEWMGDLGLKTLYYAEYANTGPGAGTSKRVTWPGYRVIGQAEATHFTAGVFIDGMTWLQKTNTPNVMGFIK